MKFFNLRQAVNLFISGVAPQMDDTDKMAVSVYGKDAAVGDKALNASAAGDLEIDLVRIKGVVAPQLDDTDKIATSIYGKDVAAGDVALNASAAGNIEADILVAGVAPGMDDTTKLAVSLYGKDVAAGDIALNVSASGNLEVDVVSTVGSGRAIDDGPFAIATDDITVIGALADETATDSVDEGDSGALRMTLSRKMINASEHVDDDPFVQGTDYTGVMGAVADEAGTDSVDEGDSGYVRMSLDRRLMVDTDLFVGAVPLQLDDTSKLAISLYGKNSAVGDIPLNVSAAGNLEVDVVELIASSDDTVGFQSLTVSSAAVQLTPAGSPTGGVITVADADIRFRTDGSDPTTSIGHVVFDGGVIHLTSAADLASFSAIRDGGVDAILSISYLS